MRSALTLALLCASILALASAPQALATVTYEPIGQIPATNSTPSTFSHILAESAAVSDKNEHILVADSGSGLVYDFSSAADTVPAVWDGSATPAGSFGGEHVSVAVDNTTGDVYVADATHAVVDKFDENGTLIETFGDTTPIPNGQLSGSATPAGSFSVSLSYYSSFPIAVDQATHDLYVVDAGHQVIDVFDENGKYLSQITATPEGLYGEGGAYTTGIAVNATTGNVYVADWGSAEIFKFSSSGGYVSTWNGATLPNGTASETPDGSFGPGGSPIAVSSEDASGHVLVLAWAFAAVDLFDETGNFLPSQLANSQLGGSYLANSEGIAIDQASRNLYISSNASGTVQIFKQLIFPDVTLKPPTALAATSATLNGHVDPVGAGYITGCHFEYISYGDYEFNLRNSGSADPWGGANQVPCAPGLPYPSATDVSAKLTGLTPGTGYHYRLIAFNAANHPSVATGQFASVGRYQFSSYFGSAGGGDGQLNGPQDVAANSSNGDIYVADTGNHRIVNFGSAGNFLAAWGWGVADGTTNAFQTCTSGCHAGLSGSGSGQFTTPKFIKVDNSGGPSHGDVYVADTADGVVQKFDPSGNLISSWGSGGAIDLSNQETVDGITVDPLGDLFVLTEASPYYWTEFSQDGAFVGKRQTFGPDPSLAPLGVPDGAYGIDVNSLGFEFEPANGNGIAINNPNAPFPGGSTNGQNALDNSYSFNNVFPTGLVVDRSTNDLYVDHDTFIRQFPTSGGCFFYGTGFGERKLCQPSDFIGLGKLNSAAGLAFNPSTGVLYAADAGADDIAVFAPLPLPDTTTNPVTDLAPTSVTLTGHLTPHGAGNDITDCHFEYGKTPAGSAPIPPIVPPDTTYSLSVPCSQGTPISSPTEVSAELTGLQPFATYHYRLVATGANDSGLLSYGRDRTFTPTQGRAPAVDATSSSGETPTTATLSAQVNPNLAPTVYRFQYGADAGYGSQTLPSESIGEDGVDHSASAEVTGLSPGTTYHYRVLAVNFNGITEGPDRTFNTPDVPSVADSAASDLTATSATLSAQVRPGFRSTTYSFQYGPTSTYGSATAQSAPVGSDDLPHAATSVIAGLAPATTYHFRIIATNAIGTTDGSDQTFTTAPAEEAPPATCHKGFVLKHGHCAKKSHHKKKHNHRGGKR